jgi:heptosyltransferase-2
MPGSSEKILIIKLSALGDLFMALPHIEVILNRHIGREVWLMTDPAFGALFSNDSRIRVVSLDRSRRFGAQGPWARAWWVYRKRFGIVYDLQGNRSSRRIVRFSAAPTRVGTQPDSIYHFHPQTRYARETEQNVFDRLNETLAAAGLPPAKTVARLHPSDRDEDAVSDWAAKKNLQNKRFVLMHAGSSRTWLSKRWPEEHFQRLAAYLEAAGISTVWIGAEDDREVNRSLSRNIGVDATRCFSLLQLFLLGEKALFAVTNDSGPMHILAAAGIPVFAFFGPTHWVRSHAVGQKTRVFASGIECSPCFSGTCLPGRGHRCLDCIEPEAVFEKIEKEFRLSPE